ncbi:hypothetical protein KC887_08695 [Candidatus Kaiserbacteria bacterium]|nr:hypothetical protein [Candidatus Kaiserbacteria bacterium]
MTNALTIYGQFETLQRAAMALYKSNYFGDSKSEAQAIVKVMAGAELGLPPFASMTGIHIIQGKPALGANVIATLIKNDPRYNYRVLEMTDETCSIEFYENGQPCGISEFTAKDAQRAQVKNMNKFPRNMLFARAISNGAKWYTPGIFGGAPVYTPDELGADYDEEGYMVIEHNGSKQEVQPDPVEDGHFEEPEQPAPTDWSMDFLNHCADNINRYAGNPHKAKQALMKQFNNPPATKSEAGQQFKWLKEHAAQRDMEELEVAQKPLFDDESEPVADGAYSN